MKTHKPELRILFNDSYDVLPYGQDVENAREALAKHFDVSIGQAHEFSLEPSSAIYLMLTSTTLSTLVTITGRPFLEGFFKELGKRAAARLLKRKVSELVEKAPNPNRYIHIDLELPGNRRATISYQPTDPEDSQQFVQKALAALAALLAEVEQGNVPEKARVFHVRVNRDLSGWTAITDIPGESTRLFFDPWSETWRKD
jgi:hypothetical protein